MITSSMRFLGFKEFGASYQLSNIVQKEQI